MRMLFVTVYLCGLSILTAQHVRVFQTNLAVWEHAIRVTPTFRAYMNYRNALLRAGDLDGAISLCAPLMASAHSPRERRALARVCWQRSP